MADIDWAEGVLGPGIGGERSDQEEEHSKRSLSTSRIRTSSRRFWTNRAKFKGTTLPLLHPRNLHAPCGTGDSSDRLLPLGTGTCPVLVMMGLGASPPSAEAGSLATIFSTWAGRAIYFQVQLWPITCGYLGRSGSVDSNGRLSDCKESRVPFTLGCPNGHQCQDTVLSAATVRRQGKIFHRQRAGIGLAGSTFGSRILPLGVSSFEEVLSVLSQSRNDSGSLVARTTGEQGT